MDSNYTNFGYVEENTFGTTPGSALQLLRRTGGSLSPRQSTTRSEEIRSDLRAGQPVRTLQWGEGTVDIEFSYNTFNDILEGMLMEDWTSNVLVDGTTKKSYTMEDQFTDPDISPSQYLVYKGCRISSLNLSLATESIVTGSFGVMSKSAAVAQATAGTGAATAQTTTTPLNTVDMITAIEEAASGSTASSLTRVMGVDLSLERDIRRQTEIGSLNPFGLGVGRLIVTGTIQQHFNNDRLMDAFFAYTDRLLNIDFTDDDGNLIELELPKIKLDAPTVEGIGTDSDVIASFPFEAYADIGDAALIRLTKTDA